MLSIDPVVKEHMKRKFDISYIIAKEHLPFIKYSAIHELEERHGVDLGFTYCNHDSAHSFVHYIAESQRNDFYEYVQKSCRFYSILMDKSTDQGRIENELFVLLYCYKDDSSQEMKTCSRHFSVIQPKKADADGFIDCLGIAAKSMNIEDILD